MEFIDRLRKQRIYQKFLKENLPVNKDNEWLLCKELSSMLKSGNRTLVYRILDYSLWTEESYQCFLKQYKKDPECVEKILKSAPDLFETDVFDMFDLTLIAKVTDIEKFSELYKKINNKEKLLKLYHLPMNGEEQSYILNHNVWLQKLLDSSMPAEEILSSLSLWPKILSISNKKTKDSLFDLLAKGQIKECTNLINFMARYQIDKIGKAYEPMIANMNEEGKNKLYNLINHDKQVLQELYSTDFLEAYRNIDAIKNTRLQRLYLDMTPESELMKNAPTYQCKISNLLFGDDGDDFNTVYCQYYYAWEEIISLAECQHKDVLVRTMNVISQLQAPLRDSKQMKELYNQHKMDHLLNIEELKKELKQIYVDHLNDGLFDPKVIPDEEGNYGKYEVSYVMYENKPIKKIIVRDPDFYMDISNIIDWSADLMKKSEYKLSTGENPWMLESLSVKGSNTFCTSLINRTKMETFREPVVTGGISSIDSERLFVAKNADAGSNEHVFNTVEANQSNLYFSKENLLSCKKLINNVVYQNHNEISFFRYYQDPDTRETKKQGFDYMVTFPHSKLFQVDTDLVLKWASTYNIPWVEIDGEFMYQYSEMEFKNFVTKVHESPEMMAESDYDHVKQMLYSMDSFRYDDGFTQPYALTEAIDYMINWEQKEHHVEDLEMLQRIIGNMSDELLNNDIHYTDEEKKKIKENDYEYRDRLCEIKMEEKRAWKAQWIARIQNEMVLQSEQHKTL